MACLYPNHTAGLCLDACQHISKCRPQCTPSLSPHHKKNTTGCCIICEVQIPLTDLHSIACIACIAERLYMSHMKPEIQLWSHEPSP